ncbi:hypothetical protein ABZV14_25460 [Streptosporangium canum]
MKRAPDVGNLLDKLDARDRAQAAVLAYELGLAGTGVAKATDSRRHRE